jgi:hypothetical protein
VNCCENALLSVSGTFGILLERAPSIAEFRSTSCSPIRRRPPRPRETNKNPGSGAGSGQSAGNEAKQSPRTALPRRDDAQRLVQARADILRPIDFIALLVHDEMDRRRDRLIERRAKSASFRDRKTLDTFDWKFNSAIDRALVYELATARFIERRQDCLIPCC